MVKSGRKGGRSFSKIRSDPAKKVANLQNKRIEEKDRQAKATDDDGDLNQLKDTFITYSQWFLKNMFKTSQEI